VTLRGLGAFLLACGRALALLGRRRRDRRSKVATPEMQDPGPAPEGQGAFL
jgi:hypothetical protein